MIKSNDIINDNSKLSKDEIYSPHVIESKLRNDILFQEKIDQLYALHSPRFQFFSRFLNDPSGKGFDLQMNSAFVEFLELLETTIDAYLLEIEISMTSFMKAIEYHSVNNDTSVSYLLLYFSSFHDFEDFGIMMEKKCIELYPSSKLDDIKTNNSNDDTKANSQYFVRVLWDIENIRVQKEKGGLNTVDDLNVFLRQKGLFGNGIDTRITAFYNPKKSGLKETIVEELDKASVELVYVSSKREDADRKLGKRISQEISVLKPSQTTFIIISSDQDFRHQVQVAVNAGYKVIIIHDAEGRKHTQTLELHATESYQWRDIVGRLPIQEVTKKPCKFFASGNCKFGDNCKFKH